MIEARQVNRDGCIEHLEIVSNKDAKERCYYWLSDLWPSAKYRLKGAGALELRNVKRGV